MLIFILLFSCRQKENDSGFIIRGQLNGISSEFIYLNYENFIDSSLVKDGEFFFKGNVMSTTQASFSIPPASTVDIFYLENNSIEIGVEVEKKEYHDMMINFISINYVKGTNTSKIQSDFKGFKEQYAKNPKWKRMVFTKLKEIIEKNPTNPYSADVLRDFDTVLDRDQLKMLYNKLSPNNTSRSSMAALRKTLYPELAIKVNNKILDFDLPNIHSNIIDTKKYRGSVLLIDFWASWCIPCRKQIPELSAIYNKYRIRNFAILGVSLDVDEHKWMAAINEDKTRWEQVIDTSGFYGNIAVNYNITFVPYNILVDEMGKIIALNIRLKDLDKKLEELLENP